MVYVNENDLSSSSVSKSIIRSVEKLRSKNLPSQENKAGPALNRKSTSFFDSIGSMYGIFTYMFP